MTTPRCIRVLVNQGERTEVVSFESYAHAVVATNRRWKVEDSPLGPVDGDGREVCIDRNNALETEIWSVTDGMKRWTAVFYWGA